MLFGLAQSLAPDANASTSLNANQVEAAANPKLLQDVGDVILPYLPVFFVAFVAALVATPIMRRVALKTGIVDKPNEARKIHKVPIAYLGGVAIFLGWLAGVGSGYILPPHNTDIHGSNIEFPFMIVIGGVAILTTGLFDDIWGISPRVKVGGQLFAAAALASQNVGTELIAQSIATIQTVFVAKLGLPEGLANFLMADPPSLVIYLLGTAIIALFVIGACNAVNLIDGMDGLAAGTSSISAIGLLLIAAILAVQSPLPYTDPIRIVMSLAMLGCLMGFLPYNFNPANIFMGDAGSLLVGYLSAASILLFSYNTDGGALKYTTACLLVLAFPITDTSLAIFRRKMAGKPLFSPDDRHIHHVLKKAGFKVKPAVFLLYGVSFVFMCLGVAMVAVGAPFRVLLTVAMVLYAFIFVSAYKIGLAQVASQQAVEAETSANDTNSDDPATAALQAVDSDNQTTKA